MNLHLAVNGSCHDIAWSQRKTLVVFLHEFLTIGQFQYSSITAHCLCDKVSRMCFGWIIKYCRVELHKLHILDYTLCTIYHSNAITSCNVWIRSGGIYGTRTTRCHQCYSREESIHLLGIWVKNVGSVALYVRHVTVNLTTQMVLSDYFHCIVIFEHGYLLVATYSLHKSALYLEACIIGVMKNTKL